MYWYKDTSNEARLYAKSITYDGTSYAGIGLEGSAIYNKATSVILLEVPSRGKLYATSDSAVITFQNGGAVGADSSGVYVKTADYDNPSNIVTHRVVWKPVSGTWVLALA